MAHVAKLQNIQSWVICTVLSFLHSHPSCRYLVIFPLSQIAGDLCVIVQCIKLHKECSFAVPFQNVYHSRNVTDSLVEESYIDSAMQKDTE
jgi:hypothetical protein